MSLHPHPLLASPEATARVAHAAFPRDPIYLRRRDELGAILADHDLANLFPWRGPSAEAPWRLALVTILQDVENGSDRQAAEAVRSRLEWQSRRSLELTEGGLDSTGGSEWRTRLLRGAAEQRRLDAGWSICRERKWLKARGRQRTDATPVLARGRAVNRLDGVGETLRHALNRLAVAAPEGVHMHCPAEEVERYGRRVDDDHGPKKQEERPTYAEGIGTDGQELLAAIYAPPAPRWGCQIPAVERRRRVWVPPCYLDAGGVHWRTEKAGIPPSLGLIRSPYDVEAHDAKQQTTSWVGYQVPVSEPCAAQTPHLSPPVATTAGPVADGAATPRLHQALERKGGWPHLHLVDTGSLEAERLVTSQRDDGVDWLGPTRADDRWQAQAAQGFDAPPFQIAWDQPQAIGPHGCRSSRWTPAIESRTHEGVKLQCSMQDSQPCPSRIDSTRATRRTISVCWQEPHLALQAARTRESTEA